MSRSNPIAAAPKARPDYTEAGYWRGTIKMSLSKFFILRVLQDGPAHGYDIARAVEKLTSGCCSPSEGTIYPVLREFEEGQYLTSESQWVGGRERKVYGLTDKGRLAFRTAVQAWLDVSGALLACRPWAEECGPLPAGGDGVCCPPMPQS